jgi:hypothetical protein
MHVFRVTVLAATFSTLAFVAQVVAGKLDAASTNGLGNQATDFAPNLGPLASTGGDMQMESPATPPPAAVPAVHNNMDLANPRNFSESVNGGAASQAMLTHIDPIPVFPDRFDDFYTVTLLDFDGFRNEGLDDVTFSSTSSASDIALDGHATAIPLPASALLLLGALGGLGMLSRRRKTFET